MNQKRPAFARWLDETNDVTRMFLAAGQIPDLINLAGGLPEPAIYPVPEFTKLAERAMTEHTHDALNYSAIEGLPALRDQIAKRFSSDHLNLSRDNVLITTGGMQGLDLIGKVLIDKESIVATQSPIYLGALDAWRPRLPTYRSMFPIADDFDPTPILSGAQFAYTVPNFSNPTGQLINTQTRELLVDAAHQSGTWLIEDDPYGTLYYDSTPLPRMLDISADRSSDVYDGPVVYLGTLSKELAPGLRIGWVIASADMIQTLTIAKQGSDMCTSGLTQCIALDAMNDELDKQILPAILDTYRTRRDAICEAMDNHLSDWFEWEKPVGGMFVWATAKGSEIDTDRLLTEAMNAGVCISPSSVFDPEGNNRRSMRINFTRNEPVKLIEGIRRLGVAIKSLLSK